ncbi:MAG: sigma-70 family RNA polymerase sigma factor [Thermoanaerobaculia bacterium]
MTDTHEAASLAEQFERNRLPLRALAYRLLGSFADAEDVVQETWVRLSRSNTRSITNIDAWLTTIAGRLCLDLLRVRKSRKDGAASLRLPDPIVTWGERVDPEQQVLLGEHVGFAMLVVTQALSPPERVAYVLHDMFNVPFDDIAAVLGRTPLGARQLASRARRRVRDSTNIPLDRSAQRRAVEAFMSAARTGDFEALLAVLDPDVVLHSDHGTGVLTVRGADRVGLRALAFTKLYVDAQRVLVNGIDGMVTFRAMGELMSVLAFKVVGERIVEICVVADPARVGGLAQRPKSCWPRHTRPATGSACDR